MTNRFIRGRCPLCKKTSPGVDQAQDLFRHGINDWWILHTKLHMQLIIEFVPETELEA